MKSLVRSSMSLRVSSSFTLRSRLFCAFSSSSLAACSAAFSSASRCSSMRLGLPLEDFQGAIPGPVAAKLDEILVARQDVDAVEDEGDVVEVEPLGLACRRRPKNVSDMRSRSAIAITLTSPGLPSPSPLALAAGALDAGGDGVGPAGRQVADAGVGHAAIGREGRGRSRRRCRRSCWCGARG